MSSSAIDSADGATAEAFASSWNHLSQGSVYSREQFLDWFEPIDPSSLAGTDVLEMGFGNGSLLLHVGRCKPRRLVGIDLGDTLAAAQQNLSEFPEGVVQLHRGDMTRAELGPFDTVYCIGVLHHLKEPRAGFEAVLRHTRPGGRFHCWVYGWEGNALVRLCVDPIRKLACRLPWWLNKYALALPLTVPFYVYCKSLAWLGRGQGWLARLSQRLPLQQYAVWIARREFAFFHHVAFDQLVTPRTTYIKKDEIVSWLAHPQVDPTTAYIRCRNGNSWKFGARRREDSLVTS